MINHKVEIERIIRVDHAGELGAINIYKAQLMVSKLIHRDIVADLEEMLHHEKEHFATFDNLLKKRSIRSCYALWFWAFGGFTLGMFTALLGRNAIWVCTNAIETTVLHHLNWQLSFLEMHDKEVFQAVKSIEADEKAHQDLGATRGEKTWLFQPIFGIVKGSTKCAIWLSTKL